MHKNAEISGVQFLRFGAFRGAGGYAPCKPIFSSFRLEETLENGAYGRPQAVLAIFGKLPEGNLRVLGCIGSLFKTHTGVTAHLWTASGCPASENGIGNKKTATAHSRHQMPVKLHSSLCVFL